MDYCCELVCPNEAFDACLQCSLFVCSSCSPLHICGSTSSSSSSLHHNSSSDKFAFSVASWNILAKSYCSSDQYSYCPRQYLEWEFRRKCVVDTLLQQSKGSPSVICFQEMEDVHWFASNLPGYDYVFIQRGGGKEDGCAIFWKTDVFERVVCTHNNQNLVFPPLEVHFNDLATRAGATKTDQVRMLRHNVGLAVALRHRRASACNEGIVLVGTTHLYWNPLQEDVKLRQMAYFFQRLEAARESLRQMACPSLDSGGGDTGNARGQTLVSTVICGDFNSTPRTGLYNFVMSGAWHPSGGVNEEGYTKDMKAVKVLMDAGMHRVARWLRGVGVDAACWDESPITPAPPAVNEGEEKKVSATVETMDGSISTCACTPTCIRACTARPGSKTLTPAQARIQEMFNKARLEKRILITHSSKLIQRRNCPPYFLVTATGARAFKEIVEHFGLRYDPAAVYSRCTVCNGDLESASVAEMQKNPPAAFPPALLEKGVDESGKPLEFFRCMEPTCGQVFWWGPRSQMGAELLENKIDRVRTTSVKADDSNVTPEEGVDGENGNSDNSGSSAGSSRSGSSCGGTYTSGGKANFDFSGHDFFAPRNTKPVFNINSASMSLSNDSNNNSDSISIPASDSSAPSCLNSTLMPSKDPTALRSIKKGEFKRFYTLSHQKDGEIVNGFVTKDATRASDVKRCNVDIFVKAGPPPQAFVDQIQQAVQDGTFMEALESLDRYYCVRSQEAIITAPRPIKRGEFKRIYTLLNHKVGAEGEALNYITKEATRVSDGKYFYVDIFSKPRRDGQPPAELTEKISAAVKQGDFVEALESADRFYCVRVSLTTAEGKKARRQVKPENRNVDDDASPAEKEVEGVDLPSDFTGALSHRLSLYSTYQRLQGEPAFTNFTGSFRGCLDYIFAEPSLQAVAVRPLQTEADAVRHTAFPSEVWPSDHLLLQAHFTM